MSGERSMRRALPADLDALLRVAGMCAEAPRWNEHIWRGILADGGGGTRAVFVVERRCEAAGFIVAALAADVVEIESVAVLAPLRRTGLGRALCMEAISWARSKGASAVELEVRSSSLGAIALYESLGFVVQGQRTGYYRDPVDNAVLMARDL